MCPDHGSLILLHLTVSRMRVRFLVYLSLLENFSVAVGSPNLYRPRALLQHQHATVFGNSEEKSQRCQYTRGRSAEEVRVLTCPSAWKASTRARGEGHSAEQQRLRLERRQHRLELKMKLHQHVRDDQERRWQRRARGQKCFHASRGSKTMHRIVKISWNPAWTKTNR